jgi:HAD superfamily hydrolase (TIGR01509 family)
MITKKIKLISFDIGNTLIQLGNEGFCSEFSNKTGLTRDELRPLFFEYFLTKNYSLHDAVYKVCSVIGYKNPQKIIDEYQPSPIFLFEDTIPVLEQLYNKGISMIATSNCTPWESGGLESLGLDKYLKGIFYSYVIGYAKPNPAYFLHVQKAFGVPPENILHIGDSHTADYEGAKAVGWQAILLDRDNKTIDFNNGNNKITVIKNLTELIYSLQSNL